MSSERLSVLRNHLTYNSEVPRTHTVSATSMSNLNDDDVCIVSAVRTPIGSFNGALASLSATELGSIAIKGALNKANVAPDLVEEVFFGNVLSTGLGQAPAKQAALGAGIPVSVPCTTINKVCASGLKAIGLAMGSIQLGYSKVAVAGGMESMSNVPYCVPGARDGLRMGHASMLDVMIHDGLWDPYDDHHMGNIGELCSAKYNISRAEQDEYCVQSYRRAAAASSSGKFINEIVPVTIESRQQKTVITEDEEYKKVALDKIVHLRSAFKQNGTITAANASSISDGAASLVLTTVGNAKKLGLPIRAIIKGFVDASQEPNEFTTTPAKAITSLLSRTKISIDDIDYFEINEAFSVVALVNMKVFCFTITSFLNY